MANSTSAESINEIVSIALEHFRIDAIADCARGPQLDRVKALDQLAQGLSREPRSASGDALLGFAASLVDPGLAVLPNLFRKYASRFPMAPLWLGAFAGCWSPARVLSDYSGLGRLIAKALLSESDLEEKPQCDISYDEIIRWLNGVTLSKLPLRGMAARSLSIEITLGVTCPFAIGRTEASRVDSSATYKRDDQSSLTTENQRTRTIAATAAPTQIGYLARSMDELTKRIDSLEKYVSNEIELKRKIAAEESPRDLLTDLPSEGSQNSKKKR
ncbi:hypothetical protein [Tardiphaga sp. 841_E9_N1_2]|uniref:hypothetical protein n=1 Tax=Tardiphaga sp. 841_E9_N1_2 TaxID=3240762 RepID=UPI003F274553